MRSCEALKVKRGVNSTTTPFLFTLITDKETLGCNLSTWTSLIALFLSQLLQAPKTARCSSKSCKAVLRKRLKDGNLKTPSSRKNHSQWRIRILQHQKKKLSQSVDHPFFRLGKPRIATGWSPFVRLVYLGSKTRVFKPVGTCGLGVDDTSHQKVGNWITWKL